MSNAEGWPDGFEFIRQARAAVGLPSGALSITPKAAWEEALERIRGLAEGRCWKCMEEEQRANKTHIWD